MTGYIRRESPALPQEASGISCSETRALDSRYGHGSCHEWHTNRMQILYERETSLNSSSAYDYYYNHRSILPNGGYFIPLVLTFFLTHRPPALLPPAVLLMQSQSNGTCVPNTS
jgi:hypothetical protein